MGYLGREAGIDPDAINEAVSEGFESAMSALKQDPTTGEMVFDEAAIDQIIEEEQKSQQLIEVKPDSSTTPSTGADFVTSTANGNGIIAEPGQSQQLIEVKPDSSTPPSTGADFVTSTANGNGKGGGVFPLVAMGLLAYLTSK